MALRKLLFVDANIWLDFYRARGDAGLSLLEHLDKLSEHIIVTHQLEMEFKKNRQLAIIEGINELKAPTGLQRPGLLSDAKAVQAIGNSIRSAEKKVRALRARLQKSLEDPSLHDDVYKVAQRIFKKKDKLVLRIDDPIRHKIRRKAFRRFMLGCPPRKRNDTSIGDALNWEWMVHCADEQNSELVIVSRDSDYGVTFGKVSYLNDHLRQEFSERVSRKRGILLYSRLSEALKHFAINVTSDEEEVEENLVNDRPIDSEKKEAS